MITCLLNHLREMTGESRRGLFTPTTPTSDGITSQTDRATLRDDSVLPSNTNSVSIIRNNPVVRVELLDLLTDVAGIMRETSRATQYANLCYTTDRNSKQIFLDMLTPSSGTC